MLIDNLYKNTISYSKTITKKEQKKMGQFFTPPSVAIFMSNLIQPKVQILKILDTGAGTGMLGGAVCQKVFQNDKIQSVHIDFYEIDENVIPFLNKNIKLIQQKAFQCNKNFTFNIIKKNFILYNEKIWIDNDLIKEDEKYDLIICNPPYKKIRKNDKEAIAMSSIVHGQPNMYFLFMAMSIPLLKEHGEMIYIVPRSFTSGAYFKKFREYLLNSVQLTHLHLFNSRTDVFDSDNILQEALILRAVKTYEHPKTIKISSSENMYINANQQHTVPYNIVVNLDTENLFIMIPTTKEDVQLLESMKKWKYNLLSLGFKIKTGPIVDFRVTEFLRETANKDTVPLFWAFHFKGNRIVFPLKLSKKPQFFLQTDENKNQVLDKKNYLLIKRFSSKEETRRIQPALLLNTQFNDTKIGIENHLNYITKLEKEMTEEELYGLFVLFNSSRIDTYYRILNGSTQVNATEINSIPLPDLNTVIYFGKCLMKLNSLTSETCDKIIEEFFKNSDIKLKV